VWEITGFLVVFDAYTVPLPSMLTCTPAASSFPVHAAAVNCTPWSVLNTSGLPWLNASSSISTQNEPSSVFDSRQAIT
jgi:hypothetical protein